MLFNRNDKITNEKTIYQTKPNMLLGCKKAIFGVILLVVVLSVASPIITFIGEIKGVNSNVKKGHLGQLDDHVTDREDYLDENNKEVLEKWSIEVRQQRDYLIKILKKKYKDS